TMYPRSSRAPPSNPSKSWVRSTPVRPYVAHLRIAYVEIDVHSGKCHLKNYAGKADPSATRFDARGITETIQRALGSAGLDTQSGLIKGIMDTINQSLTTAGLMHPREPTGAGRRAPRQRPCG